MNAGRWGLSVAWIALWFVAWVAGSPPSSTPPTPYVEHAPTAPAPRPPTFDFARLADSALYAFRSMGASYGVSLDTYDVAVGPHGAIVVTPHDPNARRATSLRVETSEIARGHTVSAQGAVVAATVDGALHITRGEVVERLRGDARGLAQSWAFGRAPSGDGDLTVRVRVDGLALAATRADGLHFADASGGPGVLYGPATFVDARGTRTPVAARFLAGAVVLTVPEAVLNTAAYPAVLDPVLSPESSVGERLLLPGRDSERDPAVATDGVNFFVVWSEQRTRVGLFGARVAPDGTILDPVGVRLARHDPSDPMFLRAQEPAVVYTGRNYFVAYRAAPYVSGTNDGALLTVRVATTGVPMDEYPRNIIRGNLNVHSPALAANATSVLMAWQAMPLTGSTRSRIYGALVDATGRVAAPDPIAIASRADASLEQPALVSNGTGFLVGWVDRLSTSSAESHAIRLSPDGTPTGSAIALQAPTTSYSPSIALGYNGTDYVAAWSEGDVRAVTARVRADGTVRDATPLPVTTGGGTQRRPRLARLGAGVMVAWSEARSVSGTTRVEVRGGRVRDDGTALDPSGVAIGSTPPDGAGVSLAANAGGALVAWHAATELMYATPPLNVYARLLSPSGVPQGSEMLLSRTVVEQEGPAISFDGTQFLVAWNEFRAQAPQLYAARVRIDGTVVDAAGFVVRSGAAGLETPRVSFNGTHHLIVWRSGPVWGRRVARDGTVVDATDLPISSRSASPLEVGTVASNGVGWMVVWADQRNAGGAGQDIFAALVNADGTVAPTDLPIATERDSETRPSAGFDGARYVVAWSRYISLRSSSSVFGRQVAVDGTLAPPVAYAMDYASNPVIVGNGHGALVAYECTGSGLSRACAIPVGADGAPGALVRLSDTTNLQYEIAATFDGTHHVVAWSEVAPDSQDILAARVLPNGTVADTTPIVVSGAPEQDSHVAAASDGHGHTLIAWQRAELEGESNPGRLRLRVVTSLPRGTTCASAAECADGFCVDGVCCESACGGGAMDDCQVCSAAVGARTNGVCSPAPATVACRAAPGECVRPSHCDGTDTRCPADMAPVGTVCDGGLCSAEGVCAPPLRDAAIDALTDAVVDATRGDVARQDATVDAARDVRGEVLTVDDVHLADDASGKVDDQPEDGGVSIVFRMPPPTSGCACTAAGDWTRASSPWVVGLFGLACAYRRRGASGIRGPKTLGRRREASS